LSELVNSIGGDEQRDGRNPSGLDLKSVMSAADMNEDGKLDRDELMMFA